MIAQNPVLRQNLI